MTTNNYPAIQETLYSETLPNGLTVLVVKKPGYRKAFALFATDYGGADRRFKDGGVWVDSPAGVAHFLEHKMFDTPDGGNALSTLSNNGASPNAYTGSAITAYHFESDRGFDENLRTLLDFVSVPYFTPESVQKEQGIIGQEIRMIEDSPGYVVFMNLMRCLYAAGPLRDSVAGTVESIAEITAETLYSCHRAFYNPSNMVLCVTGDVDPQAVCKAALDILPSERRDAPERDYGEPAGDTPAQKRVSAAMEVSAPQFLFGCKIIPAPAGEARLRQQLLGELAVACLMGPSSPFYLDMYEKGLLSNDFEQETEYAGGSAHFLAGGESRDPDAVFDALCKELARVAEKGLDEALFSRLKKSLYGEKLRDLDNFDELCRELAQGKFHGFCALDAFSLLESIDCAQVNDFIRKVFVPERFALSVVTPRGAK